MVSDDRPFGADVHVDLPEIQRRQLHDAHHLTMPDESHPVTGDFDLAQQMGVEKYARAVFPQFVDDIADKSSPNRVEAGSGFIQKNQTRPVEQGLRQADALQHAFGKGAQ